MSRPTTFASLQEAKAALPPQPLHLAIGMFDGVHLGHQAVVETAVHSARRRGGLSGVLTFWPHPSRLFRPQEPVRQMQPPELKTRHLLALGVDAVISEPFTIDFAKLEAEAFLPFLRERLPALAAIYVGENWRFGQGRRGDVALLVREGRKHGLPIFSAPRVNHDGEPISSTRIRKLIETGEVELAGTLLGYTYYAEGVVTPGKRLGRTIGFPTLNVPWEPELTPRYGVYAVSVHSSKLVKPLKGVANYGLRPTVEDSKQPRLEVHVLEECPIGEGDGVRVEWLAFQRPEMKFSGLDELKAQILKDRDQAIRYFDRT